MREEAVAIEIAAAACRARLNIWQFQCIKIHRSVILKDTKLLDRLIFGGFKTFSRVRKNERERARVTDIRFYFLYLSLL